MLSRLQRALEEKGQQEAQAVTCGQPWGFSTSTQMLDRGCPVSRGWASIIKSAELPPEGLPPTLAYSACSSLSPGLCFPAPRPPAPPWPGLGENCHRELQLLSPADPTPIMPWRLSPSSFLPHDIQFGAVAKQQVPQRVVLLSPRTSRPTARLCPVGKCALRTDGFETGWGQFLSDVQVSRFHQELTEPSL